MNVMAKISCYYKRSVTTLKLCKEYSNTSRDIQYTSLTLDKILNSLVYRTLFYVNIYGSYKLSKHSPVFWPTLYMQWHLTKTDIAIICITAQHVFWHKVRHKTVITTDTTPSNTDCTVLSADKNCDNDDKTTMSTAVTNVSQANWQWQLMTYMATSVNTGPTPTVITSRSSADS